MDRLETTCAMLAYVAVPHSLSNMHNVTCVRYVVRDMQHCSMCEACGGSMMWWTDSSETDGQAGNCREPGWKCDVTMSTWLPTWIVIW
jgi:hypothetical protein